MESTWTITWEDETPHALTHALKSVGIDRALVTLTGPGALRLTINNWPNWIQDMASVSSRIPNAVMTVVRRDPNNLDFEKAVFHNGLYESATGQVVFDVPQPPKTPSVPLYQPLNTREPGTVVCSFIASESRITLLLGPSIDSMFSGQRGEDLIVVWRDLDRGWVMRANSIEAWLRFKRELILPSLAPGEST